MRWRDIALRWICRLLVEWGPAIFGALGLARTSLGDTDVTDHFSLSPGFAIQLYMTVSLVGIIGLLQTHWPCVVSSWHYLRWHCSDSVKFQTMADEIENIMPPSNGGGISFSGMDDTSAQAKRQRIRWDLEALGITLPREDETEALGAKLPLVIAHAHRGELKAARLV